MFNALDLMENKQFLENLKFGIGDGNLQYYLYNWKCPQMDAEKVGHVQHYSSLALFEITACSVRRSTDLFCLLQQETSEYCSDVTSVDRNVPLCF